MSDQQSSSAVSKVAVQVYAYDAAVGHRTGEGWEVFEQDALIAQGSDLPPAVVRLAHRKVSDVLAAGRYQASLKLYAGKYQRLEVSLYDFRRL